MEKHHQPKWHEINQATCGFTEISLCLVVLTTIFKWQKLTMCRSCHLHIVQNKSLKGDGKILLDKTLHEDDSYQKLWRETREISRRGWRLCKHPYENTSDNSRIHLLKKMKWTDYYIPLLFTKGKYRIGRKLRGKLVIII